MRSKLGYFQVRRRLNGSPLNSLFLFYSLYYFVSRLPLVIQGQAHSCHLPLHDLSSSFQSTAAIQYTKRASKCFVYSIQSNLSQGRIKPNYVCIIDWMNRVSYSPMGTLEELYDIDIKFDRTNSTYKPDETVTGNIALVSKSNAQFKLDVESVLLSVTGGVSLQNRQNKIQVEQLVKRVPPIRILNLPDMIVAKGKTLTPDIKLPFRFKLQKRDHKYLESYIGVYISISYSVNVVLMLPDRRMLQSDTPLYVQVPRQGRDAIQQFVYPKKKNFMVVSEDIKGDKSKIPNFKIRGQLQSQICFFTEDLHGSIVVDVADSPIRSIDLQMLRVEKVETEFKTLNQKTEIQLIQICDGNVTRNMQIPLYMILPRYYACPSVRYLWCSVNFEVNLQIIFRDGYKVTVNIPVKLIRS